MYQNVRIIISINIYIALDLAYFGTDGRKKTKQFQKILPYWNTHYVYTFVKISIAQVHFQESQSQSLSSEQVVYRRANRNPENRHSMIHYDHDPSKPQLKERPVTVYEPLHLDYRDSPTLSSPKTSKNDLRSMDSLPMDSPQVSFFLLLKYINSQMKKHR